MLFRTLLLALLCFLFPTVSSADANTPFVTVAVGHVGIFDDDIEDPEVLKLEYRFGTITRWRLAPLLGAAHSANGANFAFAAVERDFQLGENWVVVPGFGLGSFGDGRDVKLGHSLEFRSGVKVAFRFENGWRAGIALFHLSNGGLSDRNPGTEPLFLSLSIPL